MAKAKTKESPYDKMRAAGLPPIQKQAELLDKVFTITSVKRETFTDDSSGEERDFYIATCSVNGAKDASYYLAGTAVMPKVEAIEDDLPVVVKLIKKRTRHGRMYDLVEPDVGDSFDTELAIQNMD